MSTQCPTQVGSETGRRRSQRVILTLPVTVHTEGVPKNAEFQEETCTLVVNAHGALILLAGKVQKGQNLRMKNRATQSETLCRVAYLGAGSEEKMQIGVEFMKPSPDFWHIAFPPEDWTIPETTPLQ